MATRRAQIGLELLRTIANASGNLPLFSYADLNTLFGGEWFKIIKAIVGNSWCSHLHFLPADEQPQDWTGMPEHSVALFRYPLTLPIEILNCAQDLSCSDWRHELLRLRPTYPVASALEAERPMKRLTLKKYFSTDLLSRYIGLYVRLGAPDFAPQTVTRYIHELGGSSQ